MAEQSVITYASHLETSSPPTSPNSASVSYMASGLLYQTMRFDAEHYNKITLAADERLDASGWTLERLGDVTANIFIPPRFKRVYVDDQHGIPFLQGTHLPHFKPADVKFLSTTAHKNLDHLLIRQGWVLVTRSGTIGRIALTSQHWDGWAASEHIVRIVPRADGFCPSGYIYAWLSSPFGQAQFNEVYGAVVDEITAEHVAGIRIPVPSTPEERAIVSQINENALRAMEARERALSLDMQAVETTSALMGQNTHTTSFQPQLLEPMVDLEGIRTTARGDNCQVPSELAIENAKRIVPLMYHIWPHRFAVYPMPDGEIAVDASGGYGRSVILLCESDGGALCLVTLDGEHRRARYSTIRSLPDEFLREALRGLAAPLVP